MRDLILKMSMSLDGFVAAFDGGLKWALGGDPQATAWTMEIISNAGLHIMGSRTFAEMVRVWPTSTEVFAAPMNQIPKAVFSRKGPAILKAAKAAPGADSWGQAYVATGDLGEEIAALKAQEGGPIVAHGGASFVRSLVSRGLIDRYDLLVHPIALGRGLPIFSDLAAARRLELVESKAFPSGAVAQVYRPAEGG
jgi:dihydrofolate reductase